MKFADIAPIIIPFILGILLVYLILGTALPIASFLIYSIIYLAINYLIYR